MQLLKRKWHGIPFAVLAVVLVMALAAGGALAYSAITEQKTATVTESLTYTETAAPAATLYPGQSTTWGFTVANAAGAETYGVTAMVTTTGPAGTTTTITKDGIAYTGTKYSLTAGASSAFVVTITVAADGAPGGITVDLVVDRSAP